MSPSKESLERAVKWLRDQAGIMRLQGDFVPSQRESLADLLDEAIREARVGEAEWWHKMGCVFCRKSPARKARLAQLREGKT